MTVVTANLDFRDNQANDLSIKRRHDVVLSKQAITMETEITTTFDNNDNGGCPHCLALPLLLLLLLISLGFSGSFPVQQLSQSKQVQNTHYGTLLTYTTTLSIWSALFLVIYKQE
mmetsp:Transcript_18104/g.37976  ORF Transcript_18104/g.37976 Transcript_18104/m.37976 type:complete len:115 (-) Transcript_18104:103-447(-)